MLLKILLGYKLSSLVVNNGSQLNLSKQNNLDLFTFLKFSEVNSKLAEKTCELGIGINKCKNFIV